MSDGGVEGSRGKASKGKGGKQKISGRFGASGYHYFLQNNVFSVVLFLLFLLHLEERVKSCSRYRRDLAFTLRALRPALHE